MVSIQRNHENTHTHTQKKTERKSTYFSLKLAMVKILSQDMKVFHTIEWPVYILCLTMLDFLSFPIWSRTCSHNLLAFPPKYVSLQFI